MIREEAPEDLGAAAVFVVIGAATLAFRGDLEIGDAARMGPAYFPTILGWLILGIGLVLAGASVRVDGPPIERVQLRPLAFIVAAVLLFGWLLESLGLVIATIAVTLVCAYARPRASWRESLALGAGLAVFAVAVFVFGLSQPLPLGWWPQ